MKILILGNSKVGKTKLISYYIYKLYDYIEYQPTTGIDYHKKDNVSFYDSGGSDSLFSIIKGYIRDIDGIIIVYKRYKYSNWNSYISDNIPILWFDIDNDINKIPHIIDSFINKHKKQENTFTNNYQISFLDNKQDHYKDRCCSLL